MLFIGDILSGKYRFEKKQYRGLYTHLFKPELKGVALDKEALSVFKGEYFLKSGFEITEIHLDYLHELARYYQFGLKGYSQSYSKSALCYALLIQFREPHTNRSPYFEALSHLYKTGDASLEENLDLSHDFAISAHLSAMTYQKIMMGEEDAFDLANQLSYLSEKMDKKMRGLCDNSPQDLHPARFHTKLYLTVEGCLNTKSIELRYANVLDIINTLKIYMLKKSNELIKKYNVAQAFIRERLKPITIQLAQLEEEAAEARKHVLDLYSIIHLDEKLPLVNHEKSLSFAVKDVNAMQLWYLDLKSKKESLAQEMAQLTKELPERHDVAKNAREREALQQEILGFNDKIEVFNQDIQAFQKVLESRAIQHLLGQGLPWQNEALTEIQKSEFLKRHLQNSLIQPLREGLTLSLKNALLGFNQLEFPFENGLNILIDKTLREVEHYEYITRNRIFIDTNYDLRNPSIERVKAACRKAQDTTYLASSRMEYLLAVLVREREAIHTSHLYPFGRKCFWHTCLALVKRFFSSQLEEGYQRILNDVLFNQMQNQWHLQTFDFRKAHNKKSDHHPENLSLAQGDLQANLIELFSQCKPTSRIYSIFKRKNPHAQQFITFLNDNPNASTANIRAKIDSFVTLYKSDPQFVKTSMEALDLLDVISARKAVAISEEV